MRLRAASEMTSSLDQHLIAASRKSIFAGGVYVTWTATTAPYTPPHNIVNNGVKKQFSSKLSIRSMRFRFYLASGLSLATGDLCRKCLFRLSRFSTDGDAGPDVDAASMSFTCSLVMNIHSCTIARTWWSHVLVVCICAFRATIGVANPSS